MIISERIENLFKLNNNNPLHINEIFKKLKELDPDKCGVEYLSGNTPEATIASILLNRKNIYKKIKPRIFQLIEINNGIINKPTPSSHFKEKDLHSILINFLYNKYKIYSRTINANTSTNTTKGSNRWLHPDIVGLQLIIDNNKDIKNICKHSNEPIHKLFSYELKKEINQSNLKESYFQAVSNSSWANEGYLVTESLDIEDIDLMNEIERLNKSFGIGLIKLNIDNYMQSNILYYSHNRKIDISTLSRLISNKDFNSFIINLNKDVEYGEISDTNFNEINF